CQHHNAYPYSF
nr:immunoglobulin light chain junction region [Macaca mulatta]